MMPNISKKKIITKKTNVSESENEDSEHELFYYASDRIKLMKEVLKLLKPKKIKSMAPECLKDLDMEEINSMLLEELLGISKKRLNKIFDGQSNDDESSSESDEDIDIISLDDITDDDDIGIVDIVDTNRNNKRHKHKRHRPKRIKAEKDIVIKKENEASNSNNERKKNSVNKKPDQGENEKLLSVLELLELQARARAIKSQLLIEAENKQKAALEKAQQTNRPNRETASNESEDDAIIIDIPTEEQIVIASSDSECAATEVCIADDPTIIDLDKEYAQPKPKQPKFRIIRNRVIKPSMDLDSLTITVSNEKAITSDTTEIIQPHRNESPTDIVKAESSVNVPEFIGPIEMIHLDTLDVDLSDIILPEKGADVRDCLKESANVEDGTEKNSSDDRIDSKIDEIRETEEGEIDDDKEESDSDDVLQLDTVIDD